MLLDQVGAFHSSVDVVILVGVAPDAAAKVAVDDP
jgi:hypothetical protein